jgi:hypothetical protein
MPEKPCAIGIGRFPTGGKEAENLENAGNFVS